LEKGSGNSTLTVKHDTYGVLHGRSFSDSRPLLLLFGLAISLEEMWIKMASVTVASGGSNPELIQESMSELEGYVNEEKCTNLAKQIETNLII
jgi:hypothetical protein